MTSLRTRLLAGTAVATALTLLLAAGGVYAFVRASLLAEFDASLVSAARALAAWTEMEGRYIKIESHVALAPEYARSEAPEYFTLWLDDGRMLARSPAAPPGGVAAPTPPNGKPVIVAVTLPDGHPGRRIALRFVPVVEHAGEYEREHAAEREPRRGAERERERENEREKERRKREHDDDEDHDEDHARRSAASATQPAGPPRWATAVVARHTTALDAKLGQLRWLLAGVGAVATVAAALAMTLVVTRGLRPLGELAARIAEIGRDDLSRRVNLGATPAELATVVGRLNDLLRRLEAAVARERAFTADVAHEFRTPLAGLGAQLDVCATRPRAAADYQRTVATCRRIVRGMNAMVDNLLVLARADAGQLAAAARRPVALAALVAECWAPFAERAAERGLRAAVLVPDDLTLLSDPDKLRIILRNLFDNAVSYCDPGGAIDVTAEPAANAALTLRVNNTGSMVAAADAPRVFERFWRSDAARRDVGDHCGLGLSLCRAIADLLPAEICVSTATGGVFSVTLRFPAGAAVPPAAVAAVGAGREMGI